MGQILIIIYCSNNINDSEGYIHFSTPVIFDQFEVFNSIGITLIDIMTWLTTMPNTMCSKKGETHKIIIRHMS